MSFKKVVITLAAFLLMITGFVLVGSSLYDLVYPYVAPFGVVGVLVIGILILLIASWITGKKLLHL